MAIFVTLIVFSIFLLQAAGEAFPTIILQQNDGVFPNVTNTTNATSLASPSGTSVVYVKSLHEVDQMVADQIKRYKALDKIVDNDEILPGHGKDKRHRSCHLTCTPSYMEDICEDAPVLASCTNSCTLYTKGPYPLSGGNGVAPLAGNNISSNANVTADEEHVACVSMCSCTRGHEKRAFDGSVDQDDLQNLPSIKYNEDATPDTVIRAGTEIHKPLLEASTGSTMIPMSQEDVMNGQLDKKATLPDPPQIGHNPNLDHNDKLEPQPKEEPRPYLNSRLFGRNRPLALDGALADDVLITDPPSANPTSVDDVEVTDDDCNGECNGGEAQDVEADTDDED
ncbi:hypothetical protein Daus18300_010094 [Diaporthe australafricana]|uniref:Uncharacterized protein n=1 Tax=Diaporthe australafricana TaxID=127596 RepID=A0ABR3WBJ1_9PEZI